jgi:hypothetical protein
MIGLFVRVISHQPAVRFLSEQISHQQSTSSTFSLRTNQPPTNRPAILFLTEQIITSHQPNERAAGRR